MKKKHVFTHQIKSDIPDSVYRILKKRSLDISTFIRRAIYEQIDNDDNNFSQEKISNEKNVSVSVRVTEDIYYELKKYRNIAMFVRNATIKKFNRTI